MFQMNIVPSSSRIVVPLVEKDQICKLFCIVWNTKMVTESRSPAELIVVSHDLSSLGLVFGPLKNDSM